MTGPIAFYFYLRHHTKNTSGWFTLYNSPKRYSLRTVQRYIKTLQDLGILSKHKNKLKIISQKRLLALLEISEGLRVPCPVYATLSKSNFSAFASESYRGMRIRQINFANRKQRRSVQRSVKNVGQFAYSILSEDLNISKTTAWRWSNKAVRLGFIKKELIKHYYQTGMEHYLEYPPRRDNTGVFYCTEQITSFIRMSRSAYKKKGKKFSYTYVR